LPNFLKNVIIISSSGQYNSFAMLSTPLITTKFQIPLSRADLVPRPRLRALLDAGSRQPLTLISASPGFGKTMLVADWIQSQNKSRIAWLSLDESDDLSALFWQYFITALQQRRAGIGETARAMLSTPEPLALETVLATLINELAAMDEPLIMVIDDYHVIQSPDIHNSLNFYLDHQPANVHLMLLTREDPPLALARRRARRQMTEIRAADLRFDEAEAAAFLNGAMGLMLAPERVASLERRTEGWIVGLQMAALSMQGRDPQAFLDSFTGDDRYIADYLIEEVLNHQSEAIRDFLLRTSILEKLSTPLCTAVLTEPSSVELADLERANLFLIPLDNTRAWYRYHHLFADLLRQCLGESVPAEEIGRLYRDASEWCEAHGEIHAAIRYARHIPDETRVVELLHQYALLFFLQSELPQLVDFARALPPSLLEEDPHLCMAIAWAMIGTRQNPETWMYRATLWRFSRILAQRGWAG
jgi:LuxR family transcriptional regulator, maltose regulon positive regulatory protein